MDREAAMRAEIEEAQIQHQGIQADNARLRQQIDTDGKELISLRGGISRAEVARKIAKEQSDRVSKEMVEELIAVRKQFANANDEKDRVLNQLTELEAEHDKKLKQQAETVTKEKQQALQRAESAKRGREKAVKQAEEAAKAKTEAETEMEVWKTKYEVLTATMLGLIKNDGGCG